MDAAGAPIVGRGPELRELLAALERAASGLPGAVLLSGDAGVGKTRLLGAAAERARAAGARVLVGHCLDLGDVGVPFLPVAEVLGALVAQAASADGGAAVRAALAARPVLSLLSPAVQGMLAREGVAVPGASVPAADRLALFEAVEGLLADLSAAGPVVLVLEDLHWADASTRDLLRFLLARTTARPTDRAPAGTPGPAVLVLASVRAEDVHRRHPLRPLLAELGRLASVRRLDVGPLERGDLVEHLRHLDAADHGAGRSEAQLALLAARSDGNPYYAEELLASGDAVPEAVSDVLLGRTAGLGPAARRAVSAAAVGGPVVSDRLLRAVLQAVLGEVRGSEPPAGDVDAALREAVTAAVLVPRADAYAFRHALLQEAVLDDLLPGERTALHAAHARALTAAAAAGSPLAPAAELARHALASHDAPGALAGSVAAAAEALDVLAPGEALRHVEQALELLPVAGGPGDSDVDAHAPGGGVVVLAGRLGAPARPGASRGLLLTAVAAELASRAGELGRAADHARRAVALAERSAGTPAGTFTEEAAGGPGGAALRVQARTRAALHLLAADVDGSLVTEAAAQLAAAEPDEAAVDDALRAALLVQRARAALQVDDVAAAAEAAALALPLARAAGSAGAEAEARATLAVVHDAGGGDAEVVEHLDRALELAAAAADPLAASRARYLLGMHHWGAGRVGRALELFEGVGAELAAHGLAWSRYGVAAVWMTSVARLAAGDLAGSSAAAERGATAPDPVHRLVSRVAGLQAAAARGEPGTAERAAALLPEAAADPLAAMLARGALAEALAWGGRPLEAARAATDAVVVAEGIDLEEALSGVWLSALGVAALADAGTEPSRVQEGVALARRGRVLSQRPPGRGGALGPEGRAWLARLDAEEARLAGGAAVGAWRTALDAFGYGHRYELARCRWRLAQALLATGGSSAREEARELLVRAADDAEQMGAAPLAGAVRDLARRARLRLGGAAEPGPLTERESEVLALVARGLTNRRVGEQLFISEKTVSVHLSNAMAKLGAQGRAEAVAVAARRGLLAPS